MTKKINFKVLLHVMVWVIYYYLTIRYLQNWLPTIKLHKPLGGLMAYGLLAVPANFAIPYLHYSWLLQKYYFKRRYGWYIVALVLSVIAGCILTALVDTAFLWQDNQNWLMTGIHIWSRIPQLLMFILLATWARMSERLVQQQKKEQTLLQQQTEAELRWLKAQVSPHFLFNTLNNIHSLVHTKNEAAGPMLVKLADMMRYLLQDSNTPTVPLTKELEYIDNYITLNSMKQRWKSKIEYKVDGDIKGLQTEPMLLINFIENAFKHGNLDDDDAFLQIHIDVSPAELHCKVANSYRPNSRKDSTQGIGLKNVQQRLQLLYSNCHQLDIIDDGKVFTVLLTLQQHNS